MAKLGKRDNSHKMSKRGTSNKYTNIYDVHDYDRCDRIREGTQRNRFFSGHTPPPFRPQ